MYHFYITDLKAVFWVMKNVISLQHNLFLIADVLVNINIFSDISFVLC